MASVQEFKEALRTLTVREIIDRFLLCSNAQHVTVSNIIYIKDCLSLAYQVPVDEIEVVITGSAKLGFSISEKRKKYDNTILPRYRSFSANSDIDVAVISKPIFDFMWHELSAHYHRSTWFPQKTERLGDYLVAGWLRPDHFPKHTRLPRCDAWWDTFRKMSASKEFLRRRVSGGAFNSREHLSQYLSRAVRDCMIIEVNS